MKETTARRSFLGGTAALAALVCAGAGATPPNPDAPLLALCAEFHRHHSDAYRLPETGDYTWEDAIDERWATSDDIEDIAPVTEEGRRAKAAVALVLMEEQYPDDTGSTIRFAVAALRDLAGRA